MRIRRVVFEERAFGITQRSLQMLRDTLARSIDQHVAVFEVSTNDLCCGYLILNRDTGTVTFTGDGFRTDGGGEGGAGYRSAHALLDLFGIRAFPIGPVDTEEIYQGHTEPVRRKLLALAQELAGTLQQQDFVMIAEHGPGYVRG
jgi:hypothetical protein